MTTYTDQEAVDWSGYYRLSTPENGQRRSDALVKGTKASDLGWSRRSARRGAFYSTFGDIMPTDMVVELLS
jgi:hypothetical protein